VVTYSDFHYTMLLITRLCAVSVNNLELFHI
jgi:hypothetical protein